MTSPTAKAVAVLALLALAACSESPTMPMYQQEAAAKPAAVQDNPRIKVTRIGVFTDTLAYGSTRGVYLIEDKVTGQEFIGISGVGISETGSHQSGKVRVRDER